VNVFLYWLTQVVLDEGVQFCFCLLFFTNQVQVEQSVWRVCVSVFACLLEQ